MTSSSVLSAVTFVFAGAALLYWCTWIFRNPALGRCATWVSLAAVAACTAGIVLRWVESHRMGIGRAPLSNMYESLVFFSWTIMAVYLVIERQYRTKTLGAVVTPLAFLAMAYASLSPDVNRTIQPLIPALKSNWLIAHVFTCFLGYAAFAVAFGASILYLLKRKDAEGTGWVLSHLPDVAVLDDLTHQTILLGFLFLSLGIITGAVWANSAWGSYWSWDPKETWSLITWFIYATVLHTRMVKGWYGKRTAFLSVLGFAAVLFTYFGVNLLPGLHSYAQ